MSFSYLTSTASASEEGDIQDIWGYKFRWTDLHLSEELLKPTRYSYDTLGEEVLERIRAQQKLKASSSGVLASQAAGPKDDLYESLKTVASEGQDKLCQNSGMICMPSQNGLTGSRLTVDKK